MENRQQTLAELARDHLTMQSLISRIRRRRAEFLGLVWGSLLAVAAVAVVVPIVQSGAGAPAMDRPEVTPFLLSFTVAVNGQSQVVAKNGSPPSFTVFPGKHVRIDAGVMVPAHARVATLWLGVTRGNLAGPGRNGQRPPGMRPVLVHAQEPLTAGLYTFRLTWSVPAHLHPGTSLLLAAAWETRQQHASVAQPVARLVTPR
jgi:hypothetical protein